MISDNYPSTRAEALEICKAIAARQRNKKSMNALIQIINDVERMCNINKSAEIYTIVPKCTCIKCGGLIYKRVGLFAMVTPGGNSIIGCPACKTMSWELANPYIKVERD